MKAPEPLLTSKTSACAPSANFLLMMLAVISGMLSTVPVTSRNAYSRRSAGTTRSLCPVMAKPVRARSSTKLRTSRSVRYPGMDSSLSSVPPVCPRARPLIIGTTQPQAAASGASTSETLSPTPPVECLSTSGTAPRPERSITSPESIIARVSRPVSVKSIPRKYTAMARLDIW